jgi:predicted membrane chloride channel (bestrophin family)
LSLITLGLWLVANELEDPFRNAPNDLPLNNFQAQFNEALVCVFAGFHPEAWWDVDENIKSLGGNERTNDLPMEKIPS